MEKNIGKIDRILRFVIGVFLLYIAYRINNKTIAIIAVIFALISIIESLIGFCGIYKILKIDTRR